MIMIKYAHVAQLDRARAKLGVGGSNPPVRDHLAILVWLFERS